MRTMMSAIKRTTTLLTLLCSLTVVACTGERAPDAAQTAEAAATAETAPAEPRANVLSNEYAEAFTITLAPGQTLPPHTSGARAVYALSDYTVRLTQDGQANEQSWTTGQAHFHSAGEHSIENTGATEARFLVVTRTAQALPPAGARKKSASAPGPDQVQMLLNNDDVIVAEFRLAAGAELPRHSALPRLVYPLSDYTISYASNDAAAESKSFVIGQAHWHEADEHTIINTGTTDARFLIVQFKR